MTGIAGTWATRLVRVTAGYNKTPHPATDNVAPKDVAHPDGLAFRLKVKSAHDNEHNMIQVDNRGKRLVEEGAFRTLDKQGKLNRTGKPQYSKALSLVDEAEGGLDIGTQGNIYPDHRPMLPLQKPYLLATLVRRMRSPGEDLLRQKIRGDASFRSVRTGLNSL